MWSESRRVLRFWVVCWSSFPLTKASEIPLEAQVQWREKWASKEHLMDHPTDVEVSVTKRSRDVTEWLRKIRKLVPLSFQAAAKRLVLERRRALRRARLPKNGRCLQVPQAKMGDEEPTLDAQKDGELCVGCYTNRH